MESLHVPYVCVLQDKSGGRCRGLAEEHALEGYEKTRFFCEKHARIIKGGTRVKEAQPPDHILVKFSLGPSWTRKARKVIPIIPQNPGDESQRRVQHCQDARERGINFFKYSPRGASGTSVFDGNVGTIGGLPDLQRELKEFGLVLESPHMKLRGTRQEQSFVTLSFGKEEEQFQLTEEQSDFVEELFTLSWEEGEVWVNPPDQDKKVLHSVNLRISFEGDYRFSLGFFGGLWFVKIRQKEVSIIDEHDE